jgi:glycosyltransferase involved in cell wall biosynthesis
MRVAAFLSARNEEDWIGRTIKSLYSQSINIYPIVVVDDGSTDETAKIAADYGVHVIYLPYHAESWVGRPELARPFNAALRFIRKDPDIDYVLQLGADHILPVDHVETLLNRMISEPNVKIASGTIGNTNTKRSQPCGSGRLIETKFWREASNMLYPEIWGWESWLTYKAWARGYETRCYADLVTVSRPVRMYPQKAYYWGRGTNVLGEHPAYAIIRSMRFFTQNPQNGVSLLAGYISSKINRDLMADKEVTDYVYNFRISRFLEKINSSCARARDGCANSLIPGQSIGVLL